MRNANKAAAVAIAILTLAGCGSKSATAGKSPSSPTQRSITVFAASSLTGLFTDLAKQYEASHPGLTIKLSFGSSSTLAQQINEGAPANVFVSASTKAMTAAGSRVVDARNYVSNRVVVAYSVKPGTGGILVDGGGAGELDHAKTWVQCAHEAPCGAAADKITALMGVKTKPASLEPDVKSVMAKVLAGEADAGIVYLTDALAAGKDVNIAEFGSFMAGSAEAKAVTTQYMIGQVDSGNTDAAGFIAFVTSAPGMTAATALGFASP